MPVLRRFGVAACILVASAGCTVQRSSDPSAPATSTVGTPSAQSTRPCPWGEDHGQEYEPETGRIPLISTCLGDADRRGDGGGWVYRDPDRREDLREHPFTEGVTVSVNCVESDGARFVDGAGHPSTVWFQVRGTFENEDDGTGWVPHAATGYAYAAGQDSCPP